MLSDVARYWLALVVAVVGLVAVALAFPAIVVLRRLVADGHAARTLAELFLFIGVVFAGFAYVRRKGDLAWESTTKDR
jgi:NADH:ubiquinone oxidoreductase subunit 3 (subunit A)